MNNSQEISAYDVINTFPQEKLRSIFLEYGEEREAGKRELDVTEVRVKV